MNDVSPLAGLKVLEVAVAMAGPFCAMTLADYGADVVKIEPVADGDESRRWAPYFPAGLSHYFAAANRNKRSLAIDLKRPQGVALLRELAADADVLIDNFRVGALARLGLDYDSLARVNPRLVYCSISGFGSSGPRAHDRANDIFMQAFSGTMSITGEEGRGPVKAGMSVADIGAGLYGTVGVLMALQARERTGRGQHVETSLLEGQIAMLANQFTSYFSTGRAPVRRGASSQLSVPYQAFQASDDWVVIAAFTQRMWEGVCRALEQPQWQDDPRFCSADRRAANRALLIPLLGEVIARRSVADWVQRLGAEGVPCTSINSIDTVARDPQVAAREMIVQIEHPDAGPLRMAGLPVKFSDTPGALRRPPPRLGEHSLEVLRERGLAPDRIAALVDDGTVGTPRPREG